MHPIAGVLLTSLETNADERGSFTELFRASGYEATFVQANLSRSRAGVLRGLHFHRHQADLWYVIGGRAQVALVDLRTRVPDPVTATVELSADPPQTLYVPPGVAHGYLALTDLELVYWVTQEYDGSDEHGLAWDDPSLALPWQIDAPVLSDRDAHNPKLAWDQIPEF